MNRTRRPPPEGTPTANQGQSLFWRNRIAELDGDIGQAIDWYRATLESAAADSGEAQRATNALERLTGENKSIALLTREAKP